MRILKLPIVHYYSSSFKKEKRKRNSRLPLFIDSSLKIKLKITGYSFSSQLLEARKKNIASPPGGILEQKGGRNVRSLILVENIGKNRNGPRWETLRRKMKRLFIVLHRV